MTIKIVNDNGDTDDRPCGFSGACTIGNVESWARTIELWRTWALEQANKLNGKAPAADLIKWADETRHWLDLRNVGLFGLGLFGTALPGGVLDIDQAMQAVTGMVTAIRNVRPLLEEAQKTTGTATPGAIETQQGDEWGAGAWVAVGALTTAVLGAGIFGLVKLTERDRIDE